MNCVVKDEGIPLISSEKQRMLWCVTLKRKDWAQSDRVCGKHFKNSVYIRGIGLLI